MSHEHDDNDTNESGNPTFESVLTKRVSRREMFGNVAGAAALVAVGAAAAETANAQGAEVTGVEMAVDTAVATATPIVRSS